MQCSNAPHLSLKVRHVASHRRSHQTAFRAAHDCSTRGRLTPRAILMQFALPAMRSLRAHATALPRSHAQRTGVIHETRLSAPHISDAAAAFGECAAWRAFNVNFHRLRARCA